MRIPSQTVVLLLVLVVMAGIARGQGRLTVYVVDGDTGAPIPGARVVNGNQTVARGGPDGGIELAATLRSVVVSKPGYVTQPVGSATNGQVLRLQRGGVLVVQLFDELGAPKPRGSMKLECQKWSRGAVADDQGQVRLPGVPPGKCTLRPELTGTHVVMPGPPIEAEIRVALELKLNEARARARAPAPEGIDVDVRAGEELTIGLRELPERLSVITLPGLGTTGTGSIEGRLLDVDGRPGAGVPVVLRNAVIASTVVTDGTGRFLFTQIPDGDFVVTPFLRSLFSAPLVSVAVRRGEAQTGLILQEQLVGVVTGQVFDEFGDPAEGVLVQIFPVKAPQLAASGAQTDDRGIYRILARAGSYRIAAKISGARRPEELVFLPDVVVDVRAGATVSGVNVTDRRTSGGAIGVAAVTSAGTPVRAARARLMGAGEVASVHQQVTISDAGLVAFEGLTAGDYDLFITVPPQPFAIVTHRNGVATGASVPVTEFAHARVTVGAGVVQLGLQTAPGSSLRGRVEFEGGSDGRSFGGIVFTLPTGRLPSPRLQTGTRSDGSFGMDDLTIRTRIVAQIPDTGWWLKSFMVNGVNAADEPVDFAGGRQSSTDVRVVLGRTARISGTVTDENGKPMRRLVHAFPVERDRRYPQSRYVIVKAADHDGRFTLSVPPGTYWVVSAAETRVGPFNEEELLTLEPRATLTTVAEGQDVPTALRFVPKF